MKSARSSKLLKFLFSVTALLSIAPLAHAQDSGYAPPPMFDDMTPPMVRPETDDGNIVKPKASPNTVLPPQSNAKPIIVPRVSVNPDTAPQVAPTPAPAAALVMPQTEMPAIPAPPVTTTTITTPLPQQPVVQPTVPTAPPKMQPIIDPRDLKREPAPAKPKTAKPKISKPDAPVPKPPQKPKVEAPIVSKPEVKAPEAKIEAPTVPATPVAPVPPPVENKVEKKEEPIVTPVTPPQPVPVAPEPAVKAKEAPVVTPAPKIEPAIRDPKESAIKGPKTMPALPTETIDEQKTFVTREPVKEEPTILERHQVEAKEQEEKQHVVAVPKANVAPASFDQNEQGALKRTIPFKQGQIGLSSAEIDPIAVAVVKELDKDDKKAWRVQIRAYATAYGTGVSSDKRISLSRALSLRSALIAQGVPAARIDVMAEGLQSDKPGQPDRIDLYMYGPDAD